MKNKKTEISLNILTLLALVGYIVFAFMLDNKVNKGALCTHIDIRVSDSATTKLVTDSTLISMLDSAGLNPIGVALDSLTIRSLEALISTSSYVERAEVYMVRGGTTVIEVEQVRPALRVNMESGYDFYLSDDIVILRPTKLSAKEVMVVNGNYDFGFAQEYFGNISQKNNPKEHGKLKKLLNFVSFIENDEFLASLVAQIWLDKRGEVTLIPRLSDQKIVYGALFSDDIGENYRQRLAKLRKFYTKSFKSGWWQSAHTIDIRFNGQVIVK